MHSCSRIVVHHSPFRNAEGRIGVRGLIPERQFMNPYSGIPIRGSRFYHDPLGEIKVKKSFFSWRFSLTPFAPFDILISSTRGKFPPTKGKSNDTEGTRHRIGNRSQDHPQIPPLAHHRSSREGRAMGDRGFRSPDSQGAIRELEFAIHHHPDDLRFGLIESDARGGNPPQIGV